RATHRTNPAGGVTRYLYDRNDRLRKEISPYGYEPENDDGAGAAYTYDSRGNRLRTTNALGEVVQELSYNLRNQPVIQKDTFGNRTELSYELDGKIKDVRRSGNHQRTLQQYEYNARGQITGVVDGNRNPISYDVDSWGRITGIGFVDGVKEGYEYTPAGQVSRTIDGNGNAVQYRYNSLGKISERIDQLGDTETFRYDEEGNLSLHIDRDGRQLQRACNVFGQPVYEKATDAEGKHTNISTWHYDSLGRVTRAVCDGKSYEYIYDAHGNLKEKRSNGKRLVSYTHDRAGQITEIRDPAGVSTRYEYDILGRRSRIFNDDGLEVRYGYDALNRISRIHYGNGVETAYTYDGDGNIRTLETRAGEDVLLSFAYRYDGNGNRTAKTGTQATLGGITSEITTGNNALDLSYAYDVRGQLLEERRNGASVCYAYDKAGNRIRKTDAQGEIRYLYNEKNQLVEEESPADRKQFSYDRQGAIIEEKNAAGIRLFSYNSRRQQTRVETETGNVQENRYDAEGLRFELLENGRRTSFVYHNGELLQEEGREEQGTSYHLGAGMEAFRRGQELSYYHRDEQLSTVFVTDGQGEIRNSYQYDAFGISLETTEQLNNRIRYTGQQYDELTEQYYLRARYYNPVAGRFMQEDVYQGDGLNLYAYCHNNPVVYYDPSGYDSGWNTWPPQVRENINRGNNFNRENRPNYTYNEIRVAGDGKKPYFVVDSYEPPFIDENGNFVEGQIVSRKSTQLGEVQLSTALEYVTEADKKYAPGTEILDIDFNPQELRGKTLQGDLYLEVPKQKIGIPEKVSDKADSLNITIRENTEEHPKTSRNNENNLLDGLPENEENSSKSCR
ncbi:RHS repeat domain-containing protein, partial [Waltera sp.]